MSVSGRAGAFQPLSPIRTQLATFTALRSSIRNAVYPTARQLFGCTPHITFTIRTCVPFSVFSARSQLIRPQFLFAVLSRFPASLSCAAFTVFASSRNRTPTGSLPPFGVWHLPLCQLLPLAFRLLRYLLPAGHCAFLAVCLLLRESVGLTLFRVKDNSGWLGPFHRPERLRPPGWHNKRYQPCALTVLVQAFQPFSPVIIYDPAKVHMC